MNTVHLKKSKSRLVNPQHLLSGLYLFWVVVVFSGVLLILIPLMILPMIIDNIKGGRITFFLITLWAQIFSLLTGIRYEIEGLEELNKIKTAILVLNHRSFLDTPAIPLIVKGQFRALGKKEMVKVPLFGLLYRFVVVMVDRKSNESRQKSIRELMYFIQNGVSVVIFPEGRMNRTDQLLTPFYDGAFRIALETQTPVLPVVLWNSAALLPRGKPWLARPGRIKVRVLPPILVEGLDISDLPSLKTKTFETMHESLQSLEVISSKAKQS